jgi:hypothetical protein
MTAISDGPRSSAAASSRHPAPRPAPSASTTTCTTPSSSGGVALDVVTIAGGLINAGGALRGLAAGPGIRLANRATRFLLGGGAERPARYS